MCVKIILHYDLLPVNTKFKLYAIDNDTCCHFCLVGPESIFHLFGTCQKVDVLWKISSEVVLKISNFHIDFSMLRREFNVDLVSVNILCKNKNLEFLLIYLNTVINYSIWKERNEIKYNFKQFRLENIVRRMIRSMIGRQNINDRLLENRKVPNSK